MNTNDTTVSIPGAAMTHDEKLAVLARKTLANGHAACIGRGDFYVLDLGGSHLFVPVDSYEGFAAAFLGTEQLNA
jgi:hypothetical protein